MSKINRLVLGLLFLLAGCGALRGKDAPPGAKGDPGESITGPAGADGLSGTSCTVLAVPGGSQILCQDGTSQIVLNGSQVVPIPLCSNLAGGVFKEYLIRIDGYLYGVYASGSTIGYTRLSPGSWITTDGRSCSFTINSNNDVI